VETLHTQHLAVKDWEEKEERYECQIQLLKQQISSLMATVANVKDMSTELEALKEAYIDLEE
jgi:prefoldin subunit 5